MLLRLALLPAIVAGPYGNTTTTELFDAAFRAADFRQGLDLLSYNAVFVDGAEPIATTVRDCGSDVPCIAKALDAAHVDLGLRAIANFALDPPLLTLTLIGEGSTLGEAVVEVDQALDDAVMDATAKLLERYPRGGRIAVAVTPPDALVTIDPAASGVVAAGTYHVRAAKDGFTSREVEVQISEGEEKRVDLALDPIVAESSIVESPWLWTGIGAGVVAIVAVVLIATNPFSHGPDEGTACITTPAGGCPPN